MLPFSAIFLPRKDQLSDWLQKRDSHPILELSYLEVGLGSQTIHMQFGEGGAAYTLLVRDSLRCKRFFGLLTGTPRQALTHKKYFSFYSVWDPPRRRSTSCPEQRVREEKHLLAGGSCTGLEHLEEYGK